MDNTIDSLLDTYLFETNTLLDQLDDLLLSAEKTQTLTEDEVNEIFRSMHTIKGSSAMLEFHSLMTIAHHIEDLFYYIRENGMDKLSDPNKKELFNLMFESTERLRSEIEKVENNEPLSDNIDSFVNEINSFLNKISGASSEAEEVSTETKTTPTTSEEISNSNLPGIEFLQSVNWSHLPYLIHIDFKPDIGMENLRAFLLVNTLHDNELDFQYYPSDVETNPATSQYIVDNGFYLAFEEETSASSAAELLANVPNVESFELTMTPTMEEGTFDLSALTAELSGLDQEDSKSADTTLTVQTEPQKLVSQNQEKHIDSKQDSSTTSPTKTKATKPSSTSSSSSSNNKSNLISVNLDKLDALMALVGEIVITESMVASSVENSELKLDSFLKASRQLRKLTDSLQDISMSLRMVPISGVFHKMNRIVRNMKQDLGKDTRLTIIGEDTEMDKTIVDAIGDPIMHIVRNSMDHGIEEHVEDRIAAGKNPQAEIILSAKHTGSEVIITISDDGQGMDTKKIMEKAKKNDLLVKPEEDYTQKEILSFLMMPGFSTNEEVTEYSGRGVGLDVVKKNVEAIGGTVTIASEFGKGSSTTLKIPLTLSIVNSMEVAVGNFIFAIPLSDICQSFKVRTQDIIYDENGNELIRYMNNFYPVVRLHQLYNIETDTTKLEDGIVILVESNEKQYCLFLDELHGVQQVVIKPLPSYLTKFDIKHHGISGCTILGNGDISLILDIAGLYYAADNTI